MKSISDPADNFDRGFERIETRTSHGTIHIRYRLTDAEREWLCTAEPPVPPVELWSIPPFGGEDQVALDLPVLLLEILGYSAGEFVSIGHDGNGAFITVVMALANVGITSLGYPTPRTSTSG